MSDATTEAAIVADQLTKIYPSARHAADPFRFFIRSLRGSLPRGHAALQEVSFSLPRGEAMGIVGRNGSGKSTLLRILSGTLGPSTGRVFVRGRIGALLDLTSGINPDFSGRENALLLGILGGAPRRAVATGLTAVREFSGLGEAFDEPVKSYSSGMVLRLAFSAAVQGSPEILLIDEALAVGDAFFQQRCLRRIRELRDGGTSIVLVSHDPSAILSLCDRALWLEGGRLAESGAPDLVIRRYLAARYRDDCALESTLITPAGGMASPPEGEIEPAEKLPHSDGRFGNGRATILGVALRDQDGHPIDLASAGSMVRVVITAQINQPLRAPLVGFTLRSRLGDVLTATNTEHEQASLGALSPGDRISVQFAFPWPSLSSGTYAISPAIAEGNIDAHQMCDWVENAQMVEGRNRRGLFGWLSLERVSVQMSRHQDAAAVPGDER
jgi:ABC-type polysaccharide/polyol phosphate transport system ATPase subunit